MKIGLIDSGIGGLTVLKTLMSNCPNHEYIFFGDTIHSPYGEKTRDEIVNYCNNIIRFLSDKVDVIILACGTLSSNKEYLTSSIPIIDIVSPLKGKLDNYKLVSIMATPLSVKTNAFKQYINTDINLISCPKLVPIIENNRYEELDDALTEYLKKAKNSDALVLGCTHYPIIKEYIKKYFDKDIIELDSFLVDIVKDLPECKQSLQIYYSKLNEKIINNTKKILNNENIIIERKCLDDRR